MSSDDSGGFDLSKAISEGADRVRETMSVLGIERERFVCDDCGVACAATTTYNAASAAFDGGACPAWECPECKTEYIRESDTEAHAVDLYGRE